MRPIAYGAHVVIFEVWIIFCTAADFLQIIRKKSDVIVRKRLAQALPAAAIVIGYYPT